MKEFKKFCKALADESGKLIEKYFRTKINIERKTDESPVTIADKGAEELMREMIMKEFPEHGIIGEEFGMHNEHAEYKWILDPIDGTKSFITGTVSFGTLIALTKNELPLIGVINQPILNEYLIGDNETAELNGTQVKVRDCENISDATLLTADHYLVDEFQNFEKFEAFAKSVRLYRNWGDCYGYYLLSTGFADIMVDPIMNIWDLTALIPVVKGAGGEITDWQGNDAAKGSSIIASNKKLHSKIVELLN